MILVAGLGNPGPRYAETRHNIGFLLVDALAARAGGATFRERFHGAFATIELEGKPVALLKPQTFMNESGRSVQPAAQFLKVSRESLLVAYDELDLLFGEVRLKQGGGDAGHRGMRSIIGALGADMLRLRIGIGRPPKDFRGSVADFVLQGFPPAERADLDGVIARAADAVTLLVSRGVQVAMNATNQRSTR